MIERVVSPYIAHDYLSAQIRTGNSAIQIWDSHFDKPSGILCTDANLWLHIIKETGGFNAYEFDVKRLLKLVIEAGVVKACATNSLCKIIPLEQFRKAAQRSFPIDVKFLSVFQN
jgi:hypothetical protein